MDAHPGDARKSQRLVAGLLLVAAGLLGILTGAAIIPIDPYVDIGSDRYHHLDITGWGWFRLIVGVATTLSGVALAVDRRGTTVLAIVIGSVSILGSILIFPYHPLPAAITAVLAAMAVWLLAGQLRASRRGSVDRV
ncbi:hypothetical protein [Micromonospora sp. SL4-19]|uniref:DUF7144 family membrane protein n=1 Tax=Micromonospora sp. SL4-19 TaxID=3399129 RepID=UPI003A4D61D8